MAPWNPTPSWMSTAPASLEPFDPLPHRCLPVHGASAPPLRPRPRGDPLRRQKTGHLHRFPRDRALHARRQGRHLRAPPAVDVLRRQRLRRQQRGVREPVGGPPAQPQLPPRGGGRRGALRLSIDSLLQSLELAAREATDDGAVVPSDRLRHAVFCFFATLCFGEGVADDGVLTHLRALHAEILSLVVELDAFHLVPMVFQVVYYLPRSWKLFNAQKRHRAVVMALIRARRQQRNKVGDDDGGALRAQCYVDTLLRLKLGDHELVSLCWEFMNNAAAKTTTTALEWIMARLVLHQEIQQKLWNDIARRSAGGERSACGERSFVEAVVLEALPRHPPAHFLLAHTTDMDVSLHGYVIPKGSIVNYGVAEIGRDAMFWAQPYEFRPERFLEGGEGSSIRGFPGGSSGGPETMKMIPFGAGRRACPGAAVAVKVLQSFIEDLVKQFEWKPVVWRRRQLTCQRSQGLFIHKKKKKKPGIVTEMGTPLRTRLVVRQHAAAR